MVDPDRDLRRLFADNACHFEICVNFRVVFKNIIDCSKEFCDNSFERDRFIVSKHFSD